MKNKIISKDFNKKLSTLLSEISWINFEVNNG